MKKLLASTVLAVGLMGFAGAASAEECGRVTIANMNWASAEVLANIDQIILSEGYGCQAELVAGDTTPTLTSMVEKQEPDVAPEAWINSLRTLLDAAVAEGKLHYASESLSDGGVEGWWIPKYTAEAHPELFPAPGMENEGKGGVYNCPEGWGCRIITTNLFKAYGAEEKGWVTVETGSAAGLDGSIAKAYERENPWLGYYWAPTAILGKYEMVKLDAGVPHDDAAWKACNSKTECDKPQKNDWARAEVFTVITDRFQKAGGPAVEYLAKRSWGNDTVNGLLAWMSDNQATGEDGARHFLKTQPEVWEAWVSKDVADKVRAALDAA